MVFIADNVGGWEESKEENDEIEGENWPEDPSVSFSDLISIGALILEDE